MHDFGSDSGPGPGPAPPPSLTLPSLRELDKAIRSEQQMMPTGLGTQVLDPRPPHLPLRLGQSQLLSLQHQPHPQHNYTQYPSHLPPSPHGPGPQRFYARTHHSRHSSSAGSLPDLYMSSTSAPSTTTTSSLSRADSLSSTESLQGARHPHHSGLSHRHYSSANDNRSTTAGPTTSNSLGYTPGSGNSTTSSRHSFHHQQHHYHSAGLARANLTAAAHQQQLHRQPADSATPSTDHGVAAATASSSETTEPRSAPSSSGKAGSTGSSTATEQQGRNTSKRAAQNRAAQRAFRQRKDLYVRELERKAELLQQTEGKILQLAARNRELEAALAISSNDGPSSSPSSQEQSQTSPNLSNSSMGLGGLPTKCASPAATTEHGQEKEPTNHGRERTQAEKPQLSAEDMRQEDRLPIRPVISRHASSNQLHDVYTNPSHLLAGSSRKQSPSIRHRQSLYQLPHQRSEFENMSEGHGSNDANQRTIRRQLSESSFILGRRESNSAESSEGCNSPEGRREPRDARDEPMELNSEPYHSSNTAQPEYSGGSSIRPYVQQSFSGASQQEVALHGRSTLSRNATAAAQQQGIRYSNPPLARSWSYRIEESAANPRSPVATSASQSSSGVVTGGMASSNSLPERAYGDQQHRYYHHQDYWGSENDMEYISDEQYDPYHGYNHQNVIKKQPSNGSIGATTSGGDNNPGRPSEPMQIDISKQPNKGGGAHINEPSVSPHNGSPEHMKIEIRKQASWDSFSTPNSINLTPISVVLAVPRDTSGGMDIQEPLHRPHQQQQSRHLQHRASTGSVSVRDISQHYSSSNGATMHPSRILMVDDPVTEPSDGGDKNGVPTTPPHMTRHQQQYFYSLEQQRQGLQQQRRSHPQSPAREHPSVYTDSPNMPFYTHQQQYQLQSQKHQQGHAHGHMNGYNPLKRQIGGKFEGREGAGSDMEAIYQHSRQSSNETSMRSS
ncbi:hypothetical protein BX616_003349 [Lobosporangium transversale]|uniref:BZIP domain-containing protein n=1 Tax=Lobosporangium transversale TaxID=64571 RepID=A0A1Y2GH53_9FUNG|nr:hypothetical protein BCR41DRAFT_358784 [Lobosporangium transversale]KAF9916602.1 hypothetical protein BX616_003349 [Lobosporangium transversale]ORZ09042.1 hypothetical protein BCR41DRAFT_358784 [Lobosporangium transversale]|eukprot:XP_021878669.1 hypothetical protein BCR41DRAFT_358784 [Lobosporangium transversale]